MAVLQCELPGVAPHVSELKLQRRLQVGREPREQGVNLQRIEHGWLDQHDRFRRGHEPLVVLNQLGHAVAAHIAVGLMTDEQVWKRRGGLAIVVSRRCEGSFDVRRRG